MKIVPMTAAYAAEIVTWRYPPPYDLYDMSDADAATLTSADGGFFALVDRDELIGFRSFGADGQVPGGSYDSAAAGGAGVGFGHAVSFQATTDGRSYEILTRPESTAPPDA